MGLLSKSFNWLDGGPFAEPQQSKSVTVLDVPRRSVAEVQGDLSSALDGSADALSNATVFACARVIAQGLAQVPCLLQRSSASGGREIAADHPLHDLLNRAPNGFQTSYDFRSWIGFQLALTGNAYVFVSRDTQGRPIELIPLTQGMVSVSNDQFGEIMYRLNIPGQPAYASRESVWHIRGASWDGVMGLAFMDVARSAVGLSRDLERFGAELFRNGARPSGLLTTDQPLTVEQHSSLSKAWNEQQTGIANAHRTAILSGGLRYQTMQTSANEAQFTEARRFQIEEICRAMGVNPLMIGHATGSQAYASVEQMFLAHMMHTVAPLHALFEQSAECSLLSAAEARNGYRVHLDNRSMMRGSAIDRANYLAVMITNGLMTQNEGRDFEGLDRVVDPDADRLRPAQNLFGASS